jgi:hypothetical protein
VRGQEGETLNKKANKSDEPAARSEPAPVSSRLVTVKVLGTLRSSSNSRSGRKERGRRRSLAASCLCRAGVREERAMKASNKERNDMGSPS